jgi:hypothetical protein
VSVTFTTKADAGGGGGGGGGAFASKFAQTSAVLATVQPPDPWQPPPQPVKVEAFPACGMSATVVPDGEVIVHAPGHSMPGGVDVTRPLPLPTTLTVTRNVPDAGGGWSWLNRAVTV